METANSHRAKANRSFKGDDLQIGSVKLKDERGIGIKIYTIVLLVVDILLLFAKMFVAYVEAAYRLVVPQEMKDVSGEVVLVTGTGHGIGRELALQYASLGSIVVCVDINEKLNEETVNEIKSIGGKAHAFVCDVSKSDKINELAEQVRNEVGEVSILVNNAGIMPCHTMLTHEEAEIKKIFDINVFAHFWLIKAFLPSMINRNHGHIVALSSMAGVIGVPNLVPYCASKFAVRGLMEALHEELREDARGLNIKFTTIFPYMVDTGLCKKPKIRFPSLMAMEKPDQVANHIITAMRRDIPEISIPNSLININNVCRTMPVKIALHLKDFLDSGVEACD
ncbi:estradiol 17-beta-dehydrogenase 11-like isoform X2 [Arctopsyche grandis]|uniref:estradiol 17-beta-dehydrogenase 11-like isoform X2 n=1 Tax=Arctopsyche grandis TaxID=121162 RepID=UPI00406D784A